MKSKMSGKSNFANMPQDVKMTTYPKCQYVSGKMDDTMKGIDSVMNSSVSKAQKHKSNQK